MSVVASTEGFVHEHPMATVGVGVAAIVILYLFTAKHAPAPVVQTAQNSDPAAAQVAGAQIGANAQTAQAQIAADSANHQADAAATVANTSTQSQLTAALAALTSQTAIAQAQYGSAATIATQQYQSATAVGVANAQSATNIATVNANATSLIQYNNSVASEYNTLAKAIGDYATTVSNNSTKQNIAAIGANSDIATTFINSFYGSWDQINGLLANGGGGTGTYFDTHQAITPPGWSGTLLSSAGSVIDFGGTGGADVFNPTLGGLTTGQNTSVSTPGTNTNSSGAYDFSSAFKSLSGAFGAGLQTPAQLH